MKCNYIVTVNNDDKNKKIIKIKKKFITVLKPSLYI